jgi:hypothetical protein
MDTKSVTFKGPLLDDRELLYQLPRDMRLFLIQLNGCVLYGGGLHIRGACTAPSWHSLRNAWLGETAFYKFYKTIKNRDIPFAQDCVGDQYILREKKVFKLSAEDGEVSAVHSNFMDFLVMAEKNPVEFLGMQPLLQFQRDGGILLPGQMLLAYPPFCTTEASLGVKLSAVPAEELISFHIDFANKITKLKSGERFRITVD